MKAWAGRVDQKAFFTRSLRSCQNPSHEPRVDADVQESSARVVVRPDEKLQLRYAVLIHSDKPDSHPDLAAAYQDYLQLAGK